MWSKYLKKTVLIQKPVQAMAINDVLALSLPAY